MRRLADLKRMEGKIEKIEALLTDLARKYGQHEEDRLLRKKEVMEVLGVKNTKFWQITQDPTFPRPINLGPRMPAWSRNEIQKWIASKKEARDAA